MVSPSVIEYVVDDTGAIFTSLNGMIFQHRSWKKISNKYLRLSNGYKVGNRHNASHSEQHERIAVVKLVRKVYPSVWLHYIGPKRHPSLHGKRSQRNIDLTA